MRHVALLRGINVGGKNKLPMRDLAAIFEAAGAKNVRTYIQSGNVVFEATVAAAKAIPERVRKRVTTDFGIDSPVITRSASEFMRIIKAQPFAADDEKALHVAFLDRKPAAVAARALDPDRSPGDAFKLIGREIYLSFSSGVAKTRLTNDYFDRVLGTTSTVRNWRTTTRLADMVGEP